jgi:hypothetical protein
MEVKDNFDKITLKALQEVIDDNKETVSLTGNPYVRLSVYKFCENNNLKFTKHRPKLWQRVCKTHKCLCIRYKIAEELMCPFCSECNYHCPSGDYEYCEYITAFPKTKSIYVHKKDFTLNELKKLEDYTHEIIMI